MKSYASVTTKNLPKSQIEINGSIASDVWQKHRAQAIKDLSSTVKIDGFRKGMIPENVLISKIGEMAVLEEMAQASLSKAYIDILIDNKIDAIGRPEIQITKLAKDNPLEFKIVTAIVPEVKLPDYKRIAKEEIAKTPKNEDDISEKEVEEAILKIRRSRVNHEGHDHSKMSAADHEKAIDSDLPEFNDDFVKGLGGDFKDIPDFKVKLNELLKEEKKEKNKEMTRIRIADAIEKDSVIDLPNILLENELHRTESQFRADIERMGVTLEDYLKHAKKTIDDLKKDWTPHAEKKAKLQLILNAIAAKEKIIPDPKEVEAEVAHIVEHYKDADRERATAYAETVLMNEKVFQFLEGVK